MIQPNVIAWMRALDAARQVLDNRERARCCKQAGMTHSALALTAKQRAAEQRVQREADRALRP